MKIIVYLTLLLFTAINIVAQNKQPDTIAVLNKNKPADTAILQNKDSIHYATLYFYRSYIPYMNASLNKAWVYINDSLVCKLKANTMVSVKIWKQGKLTVAVDKNGETDITLSVKPGKEYYFECEPKKGLVFGSPKITLVTNAEGKIAIAELKRNSFCL